MEVHGITNEYLADKPLFKDIAQDFIDYVNGSELIIHNAPFDIGFLNHELKMLANPLGIMSDFCTVLDTLVLARQMHPGQKNSLDALCKRYFIDNSRRDLHGALLDSEILAEVYLAMTGGQGPPGGSTWCLVCQWPAKVAILRGPRGREGQLDGERRKNRLKSTNLRFHQDHQRAKASSSRREKKLLRLLGLALTGAWRNRHQWRPVRIVSL